MPENAEYTGFEATAILVGVAAVAASVLERSMSPDSPIKVTLNEGGNVATVTDDQPGFSLVVTFPDNMLADDDEDEV